MGDSLALMRAASDTGKLADKMKGMWEERTKLRADVNTQAADLILRAQVDEVFLVLAHLGEAILPLGVFNKDYYLQTLGDVKASLAICGNEMLVMAWEELDAELQYTICAGLTICAHFSPIPVYRGFGACVLSDWDWGCPDTAHLEEKARRKAIRTVYGVKQKTDPQPTRAVFRDFDHVIQILQVKPMAFFVKRPPVSGFSAQPRFGARPKKEVKNDFDLLEDWIHQIARRGHPAPAGQQITNWGFPYATWTSEYNYHVLKTEKDCETLMVNQMDPGRLLHAFVCRHAVSMDEHSMFLLMPNSPAESLACWLEGLPGQTHRIIKWQDLETEAFEKKISKSLRKKIGQHPLPLKYAVRHPDAAARPGLHISESSPAILEHPNSVSPPPYSPITAPKKTDTPTVPAQRASTVPVAELAGPETQEMPGADVDLPVKPPTDALKERSSTTRLKSIHDLRRKPSDLAQAAVATTTALAAATTRHPTVLRPGANKGRLSANRMIEEGKAKAERVETPKAEELEGHVVAELDSFPSVPARKPVPTVAVQPPPEVAELPVVEATNTKKVADSTPPPADVPKSHPSNVERSASSDTSSSQPAPVTVPAAPADTYLELLNKVARGEITPQALSEILAKDKAGSSPTPAQTSPAASVPILMPDAPAPPAATAPPPPKPANPLPYPESPTDGKQT